MYNFLNILVSDDANETDKWQLWSLMSKRFFPTELKQPSLHLGSSVSVYQFVYIRWSLILWKVNEVALYPKAYVWLEHSLKSPKRLEARKTGPAPSLRLIKSIRRYFIDRGLSAALKIFIKKFCCAFFIGGGGSFNRGTFFSIQFIPIGIQVIKESFGR